MDHRKNQTNAPDVTDAVSKFGRTAMFASSVALSTIIFGSGAIISWPIARMTRQQKKLHKWGIVWARSVIAANPHWKFMVRGEHLLPKPGQPVVYVANHVSQTDILAAFSVGMDFRWLSKASVFRVPFLGWAMKAIGYVPIDRGNKNSHKQAMARSVENLNAGIPMFFFPEGTRSPDGRLRKFRPGAFALALEASAPIVPITLEGTERLLPKGALTPGDAEVTVTIHPAIHAQPGEDAHSFAERTFNFFNSVLPEHMRYGNTSNKTEA